MVCARLEHAFSNIKVDKSAGMSSWESEERIGLLLNLRKIKREEKAGI